MSRDKTKAIELTNDRTLSVKRFKGTVMIGHAGPAGGEREPIRMNPSETVELIAALARTLV